MEVEVKVLLKEEKDYVSVMHALQDLYLKDDWHQDFFFDFADGLLEKNGSVLRLRITSPPSGAHSRAAPAGNFHGNSYLNGAGNLGPAWGGGGGGGGATYGFADGWASNPYSSLKGLGGGRLMLKEHSVVDEGSHIAFKEEDTKVSPSFVQELLMAPDIMVVLRKMSQQDPKRKAAKILENLERITGKEIEKRVQKKVEEQEEQQERLTQEILSQEGPMIVNRDVASAWDDEESGKRAGAKRPRDDGFTTAVPEREGTASSSVGTLGGGAEKKKNDMNESEKDENAEEEEEEDILIPVASSYDDRTNDSKKATNADNDSVDGGEERFDGTGKLHRPAVNMTPEEIRDEVSADLLQLRNVGNYVTHRQIYSYFNHISRSSTGASQLSPEARRQQSRQASQSKGSQHATGAGGRCASSTPSVPWTSQQLTDEEQLLREKMQIRLDLIEYPFGIRYEIEIPDVKLLVNEVSDEVVSFLKSIGAEYELGKESKFSRFRNGVKAMHAKNVAVKEVKLRLPHSAGYDELHKALDRKLIYYLDVSAASKLSKSHPHRRGSADSVYITPPIAGLSSAENPYLYACNAPPSDTSAEKLQFQQVSMVLQHNYFFDSPSGALRQHGCLLRLRCFDGDKNSFELVLKEKQVITRGSQHSNNRTIRLAPDVASRLLTNPRKFIIEEHECNEIAQVLEGELGISELDPIASFSTWRTTFKWNSPPFLTCVDTSVNGTSGMGRTTTPDTGALMIRLDKTTYPQLPKDTAIPGSTAAATQSQSSRASGAHSLKRIRLEGGSAVSRFDDEDRDSVAKRSEAEDVIDEETMGRVEPRGSTSCNEESLTCYEVEVTNLGALPPAHVKEQVTLIFRALNVEWDECSQNKLEFYMSLYESSLARGSARNGGGGTAAQTSFQWQQQQHSGTAMGGSVPNSRHHIPPAADWQL